MLIINVFSASSTLELVTGVIGNYSNSAYELRSSGKGKWSHLPGSLGLQQLSLKSINRQSSPLLRKDGIKSGLRQA